MTFHTVYTIAGYKTHYSQDAKRTLCGRDVSNAAGNTLDMCRTCEKNAAKINDYNERTAYAARAAETQDDVMHAAPVEPTADVFDMTNLTDAQTAVMETNIGRVPEVIKAAKDVGGTALVAFDGASSHAARVHQVTYYREGTATLGADIDPAAYSSAVCNANDTAREEGSPYMSAAWFSCFDSSYVFMREENESARQRAAWEVESEAEQNATYAAMLDATHVIKFVGMDVTMCSEKVQRAVYGEDTLRVSVDPSDATCQECIAQEAALAALDAAPEPSDDEMHRIALDAALTAAERRMETPLDRAPAPVHAHAYTTGADGAETPVLTLTQTARGRVLVSVGEHSREFADNRAIKLHAAMWAHSVGFQPVKGRGFKWHRDGKIMSAPARLI